VVTNVEKFFPGTTQGLVWGSAITSSQLDNLPSGSSILSNIAIANGGVTALDIFADVSVLLGSITPVSSSGALIGVGIYPLTQDGTTYGDGRFTSQAAGSFPVNYFVGYLGLQPSGNNVQEGALTGIIMPPGTFKFIFYNASGATLAGAGNSAWFRTYNRVLSA
jgi:hypothetical protein